MLILASGSPRRSEILSMLGFKFETHVAGCDENVGGMSVSDMVCVLAERKARAVADHFGNDVVLGSDTLVTLDGSPVGKPKNTDDAVRMLSALSGRVHKVYTGVSIISHGTADTFCCGADVEFYPLTAEEINSYIATGEPLDKAGAYGIQGKGAVLVKRIDGDFFTVMGLPAAETARHLARLGIRPEKQLTI